MDEDEFFLSSIQVSSASTFNVIIGGSSSLGVLISKFEGNPLFPVHQREMKEMRGHFDSSYSL